MAADCTCINDFIHSFTQINNRASDNATTWQDPAGTKYYEDEDAVNLIKVKLKIGKIQI